jgi:hypothetical protein
VGADGPTTQGLPNHEKSRSSSVFGGRTFYGITLRDLFFLTMLPNTNNIYTVCNVQTSWLLYTLVYSPRIATMEYPIVGLIILYYYDHLPQSGSDSLSFRALSALKACGFSTVLLPCSIWHSSCLTMPIVSVGTRIRLYKILPDSVLTPPSESFPYVL